MSNSCRSKKHKITVISNTGVGAQSTLGGQDIFARKICMKN